MSTLMAGRQSRAEGGTYSFLGSSERPVRLFFKTHNCTLDHRDVAPSSLSLSVKQVLRGEERGCFRSSKLLVNIPGVIHELAAREVFAVLENLVQLQVMVLVFIGDGDHLPGLVQSVVLVHRVHVLLSVAQERHQKKERWRHFSRLDTKEFRNTEKLHTKNKHLISKRGLIEQALSPPVPPWLRCHYDLRQ